MDLNTKATIYVFANFITWIILSVVAVVLIFHFLSNWILITVLSFAAVIALAYFEEKILCRFIGVIVAFLLKDKS